MYVNYVNASKSVELEEKKILICSNNLSAGPSSAKELVAERASREKNYPVMLNEEICDSASKREVLKKFLRELPCHGDHGIRVG